MADLVVFPVKDPAATKEYTFDFSDDLATGETVTSATAQVIYVAGTGDPATLSTYLTGACSIDSSGSIVSQKFNGGVHLSTYDIRVTGNTSGGQILIRIGRITVVTRT